MRAALAAVGAAVLVVPVLVVSGGGTAAAGPGKPVQASSTAIGPSGLYQPVSRTRVLDSRLSGKIAAGATSRFRVTDHGEVPATDVVAVSVNLTVLTPARSGSLSAFADGSYWPGATMSFHAGPTNQNFETVPVGAGGLIDIRNNSAAPLALVVDVLGYYSSAKTELSGRYQPTSPTRVADTRVGQPLAAGQRRTLQVTGVGRIPSGAGVAVLIFTVLTPSRSGSLTVGYENLYRRNTPSISFVAGQTEQSQLTMGLRAGTVEVRNNSAAAIQLVVDVVGYYTWVSGQSTHYFFAWDGYARAYDSRAETGPVPPGGTVQIPVQLTLAFYWSAPFIAPELSAVSMNVTVLNPSTDGSISVWRNGASWDGSATISFTAGQTRQRMLNAETRYLGQLQTVEIRNNSRAPIILIVDLNGWAHPAA